MKQPPKSQFIKELEDCSLIYAFVFVKANGENKTLAILQPLLEEFHDIMPEEIPLAGLPPMREIQHCIDLMPGVAIPNKPT